MRLNAIDTSIELFWRVTVWKTSLVSVDMVSLLVCRAVMNMSSRRIIRRMFSGFRTVSSSTPLIHEGATAASYYSLEDSYIVTGQKVAGRSGAVATSGGN